MLAIIEEGATLDEDWLESVATAILWAPPSVLGVLAIVKGPIRFSDRVVSRGMSWLAALIWLAPLPLALASSLGILFFAQPRPEEAARIGREGVVVALRLLSVLCLLTGLLIAGWASRPEVVAKPKRKTRKKRSG